jgi:F-type H+-transporting ATPase subunit epsilon
MTQTLMTLKIFLPFKVFAEHSGVTRIVGESKQGEFGLLPHRLDCVVALCPGILSYESEEEGEVFVAVDEGLLIKIGSEVRVSVRNAIGGADLSQLYESVKQDFLTLNEQEKKVRSVLIKLESAFVRRFTEIHHG